MFQFRVLVGLLSVALLHAPLVADLKSDVERFAKPFVDSGNVVAMTIGVIKGDEQHIAGFGETKIGSGITPDGDTVFEIGSISKVFTGILLAEMAKRGELNIYDPVSKHLPKSFEIPTFEGKEITLWHLASHSSALPRMPSNFSPKDPKNPYADYTLNDMAAFLKTVKLKRELGKQYDYSNLAVGLLGNALAHRAGQSFEPLLIQRVLTPLGMNDTSITLSDDQTKRFAQGYNAAKQPTSSWDLPTFAGAGALRSTARDMLKFLAANLSGKSKIEEALQLSYEPKLKLPDGRRQIALGWHLAADGASYWHNGQTGGYHAFAAFNRKGKVAVVVCITGNPARVDELGIRLMQHLAGVKVDPIKIKSIKFPKVIKVDPAVYDQYLGTYQLFPQFALTVTRQKGRLLVQATNQAAFEVFPHAKDKFFYKVVEAKVEFIRDKDDKVSHIILFQNGREMKGPRVK